MFRKPIHQRNTTGAELAPRSRCSVRVFRELFRSTPLIWTDWPVIEPFRVGYVRCSTDEQDVEIQTEQLLALSVPRERIFID